MGSLNRSVFVAAAASTCLSLGSAPRAWGDVEFDGRIPVSRGKLAYRYAEPGSYPTSIGSFYEKYGGDLFLDPLLGTARFFSPRKGVQLYRPGEVGEYSLAEVTLRFIEAADPGRPAS